MKFKTLLPLLMSVIALTGCSKNKEEAERVRVQASPPEVVEEVRQKVEQAPAPQEFTDEDRERMKRELNDPARFENTDYANKSSEEIHSELIKQFDSMEHSAKE